MPDFQITRLTVINAQANLSGTRVLASYDIDINGVRLKGCVLTESPEGIATAKGLMGKSNKNIPITAQYADPALARTITRKACEAYAALTGKELNDE